MTWQLTFVSVLSCLRSIQYFVIVVLLSRSAHSLVCCSSVYLGLSFGYLLFDIEEGALNTLFCTRNIYHLGERIVLRLLA